MAFYSWKAEKQTAPGWYKVIGWLPNVYLVCVLFDSICIYKPNMKGGHRHNHIYNAFQRKTLSKDERRRLLKHQRKLCNL